MKDLVVGYTPEDKIKVEKHITKLLKHIDIDKFILCGGIPIRYYIESNGMKYPIRKTNDLDCLLTDIDALKPSVTEDFMIYHYHICDRGKGDRDRFFIALVDKETKTKMDMFDSETFTPYPVDCEFKGIKLKMRSLEDQLVTKVMETINVLEGAKVARKWLEDIEMLMKFVDVDKAEEYWKLNVARDFFKNQELFKNTKSMMDSWKQIQNYMKKNPECVVEDPHKKEAPYVCEYCTPTKNFPLDSLEEIYRILGYVE